MAEPETGPEGIGALIGRLVAEGKGYAHAEIAYYRALAAEKLADAKMALLFGAAALVVALCAVTALLVGLILALSPLVGPTWSTVIVVAAALAAVGMLGWLAYRRIRRMFGSKG